MLTKSDLQQETSGLVITFTNSGRAMGKFVHGFHGNLAPIKGL